MLDGDAAGPGRALLGAPAGDASPGLVSTIGTYVQWAGAPTLITGIRPYARSHVDTTGTQHSTFLVIAIAFASAAGDSVDTPKSPDCFW
eukprot:COSAG02_NODE_6435_length_3570_cov_1.751368_2_plen_89_part_00